MLALAAFCVSYAVQTPPPDPNLLPIGRGGSVKIAPGQIVDLRTGKPATLDDVAKTAEGKKFFFLGEQHATAAHQQMEAEVIKSLADHGRDVSVGMEMYTRPKQDVLDLWPTGSLTEEQFLDQSDWKHQWGYDFAFYRPVFDVIKDKHLPLIALNVPRDWVHTVGKSGYQSLPISAKLQLPPELFLGNAQHREVFDSLMSGHAMTGASMDNMYAAQVLWDEGMADTALKYMERTPASPKRILVLMAGAGHMMYEQGINYRIARRKGGAGVTMVMLQSDQPVQVSRGLGDFAYVSAK